MTKIKVKAVYWCKCGNSEYPHKGRILKTLPSPHGQGRLKEYRIDGYILFCCDEIQKAYDENFIQFKNIMNHSGINAIPIGCGLAIIRTRCYPECNCEDEMYIDYCPFCGKKVKSNLKSNL